MTKSIDERDLVLRGDRVTLELTRRIQALNGEQLSQLRKWCDDDPVLSTVVETAVAEKMKDPPEDVTDDEYHVDEIIQAAIAQVSMMPGTVSELIGWLKQMRVEIDCALYSAQQIAGEKGNARPCPKCDGKGHWFDRDEPDPDHPWSRLKRHCTYCGGTGVSPR